MSGAELDIRPGRLADLAAVTAVERACFPPAEAASEAALRGRLTAFPGHFWLLWAGDELAAYVGGMTTDEPDLRDEMYADPSLHQETGQWQMIFSVATRPDFRRQGCAAGLLERAIADCRAQGRAGLVLTCKAHMVHYYARFGFVDEGLSPSAHGDAVWRQMRLTF